MCHLCPYHLCKLWVIQISTPYKNKISLTFDVLHLGTATIYGSPVAEIAEGAEMKQLVGICPQFNIIFDVLTVEEHLRIFAAIKGILPSDINSEVRSKTTSESHQLAACYPNEEMVEKLKSIDAFWSQMHLDTHLIAFILNSDWQWLWSRFQVAFLFIFFIGILDVFSGELNQLAEMNLKNFCCHNCNDYAKIKSQFLIFALLFWVQTYPTKHCNCCIQIKKWQQLLWLVDLSSRLYVVWNLCHKSTFLKNFCVAVAYIIT